MIAHIVTYRSLNSDPSQQWMGFVETSEGRLGIWFHGATEEEVKVKSEGAGGQEEADGGRGGMTRLWVVSDLHLDCGGDWPRPPVEADVAVVAGDVVDDRWIEETSALLPVIFVVGNHELYHHGFRERMANLRVLCGEALLDNSELIIGGVRFIGCSLWTDYDGGNVVAMSVARDSMNDHRYIKWQKDPWQRFRPDEALKLHRESVLFLRDSLCDNNPRDMPTVVVTHHAPSMQSIHPRFRNAGAINHAYASDLDYLVEGSGAALWIHGHVHDPFSYTIGTTRVLCNPIGYPHESGNGARTDLIVEV